MQEGKMKPEAPEDIPCACVHSDGRTCARIRDGYEPDDLRGEWRICECVCHRTAVRDYEEPDDL